MTIALIITLTLLIFLVFLRTQGRLMYFCKGELVRENGYLLTMPQFAWKIDNGFLCRLVGVNVDEDGVLPVYYPFISVSWGEGLFLFEIGRLVCIFEKSLPFISFIWDTGERNARHVSDE